MSAAQRKLPDDVGLGEGRPGHLDSTLSRGLGLSENPGESRQSTHAALSIPYPDTKRPLATVQQVQFQKPIQVFSYSHDASHAQRFDDSALRFYVDPPKRAKLDYGYTRWIRNTDMRGRLDNLLRAICEMKARGITSPDTGVISWRGIMTKILISPYEREGWELNMMFVNGVLYLEDNVTEAKLHEYENMDQRSQQQMYYGYSFESYCTSGSLKGRKPGWGGDVNTKEQWCSMATTKLGDTPILIGGEVDCVRGRYTGSNDNFVELKTSMVIRSPQDEARFEKKLLKFYFQSYLLGVPEIVVGFRTYPGVVNSVQSFKTLEIPNMVRGKPGAWNPSVCLEFGNRFFRAVKQALASVDSSSVWRATFTPGKGVSVRLMDQAGVEEVASGEDRVGFLPRWYWDELAAARVASQASDPQEATANSVAQTFAALEITTLT